jgi:hypothetical protein
LPKEVAVTNVGSIDRIVRFAFGAVLLAVPFLPPFDGFFAALGPWKFAVAAAGAVMLATAAMRFCPAYRLLGIATCKVPTP